MLPLIIINLKFLNILLRVFRIQSWYITSHICTYITVWRFNLGQYSGQLHTHGGVRNTPIDRLISSMYQWHTYCLKTCIDWHVIHILYYDQTLINSTVHSLKINIAIFKVVPSALYWWRWQWVTQNSKSDEFPKKIVENVIWKYPSGVWWKKERREDDTLIVILCNFNLSKHSNLNFSILFQYWFN